MSRGELTTEIADKGKKLLNETFTVRHLRLMPYLFTLSLDHANIDYSRVTDEEADIIYGWLRAHHIRETKEGLAISKEFYEIIAQLLWDGYIVQYN